MRPFAITPTLSSSEPLMRLQCPPKSHVGVPVPRFVPSPVSGCSRAIGSFRPASGTVASACGFNTASTESSKSQDVLEGFRDEEKEAA